MEREQLKRIIKESIEEELREGWWDRLKARSQGSMKALKQVGSNLKAAASGDAENLKNIKYVRSSEMAQSRVRSFLNKMNKISLSFINDMESLFGQDMADAPDDIRKNIEAAEASFDDFIGYVNNINDQLKAGKPKRGRRKRRRQ